MIDAIRFDGVYRTDPIESPHGIYRDYLRFYAEGEVLSVSSTGTPADLARWCVRENKSLAIGRYSLHGDEISFATEIPGSAMRLGIPSAAVHFKGRLRGDTLVLDVASDLNDYRAAGRSYTFAVFPDTAKPHESILAGPIE